MGKKNVEFALFGQRLSFANVVLLLANLFILPRISKVRNYCSYSSGRSSSEGIGHDEQLEQVVVHVRPAGRLNDECVTIAHTLANHDARFSVRKLCDLAWSQGLDLSKRGGKREFERK